MIAAKHQKLYIQICLCNLFCERMACGFNIISYIRKSAVYFYCIYVDTKAVVHENCEIHFKIPVDNNRSMLLQDDQIFSPVHSSF